MRRPSWSFVFVIFKTILVSFAIQRQSSSMACGDHHGHPLSLFSRLLKSPLPSKDNQVRWHTETTMVIHFHYLQDYFNSLCLPETSKSIGMRRISMSSAFSLFQRLPESFLKTSMSPLLCKTSRSFVDIPDASYALSFDKFR